MSHVSYGSDPEMMQPLCLSCKIAPTQNNQQVLRVIQTQF